MTAQAATPFFYRGEEFLLCDTAVPPLFDPTTHGLSPVPICSACWDGFLPTFALAGDRLVLQELLVNHGVVDAQGVMQYPEPPPLAGHPPRPAASDGESHPYGFQWRYGAPSLPLTHTGPVLIGRGDRVEFRLHGRPWPWQMQEVRLLRFDAGVLTHDEDLTERMAVFRQRYCVGEEAWLAHEQRRNAKRYLQRWTGLAIG